jgi:hypothetical protein
VGRSSSEAVRIQTRDGHVAASASDGGDAIFYAFGGSTAFAVLLVGAAVVLPTQPASALPSFARQTGQPCASCHSGFPQLTPFGRRFKLNGYTLGGTRCGEKLVPSPMTVGAANAAIAAAAAAADGKATTGSSDPPQIQIPISGMVVPSLTLLHKPLDPADVPKGFRSNGNAFVQETSVFYGGQIYCNLGAFVQGTYERPGSSYFLDNTDIRYANDTKVGGTDVVYGLTANNNPTVQDPWNTTPAWSFPFIGASDALAPTPAAGTMIEGTFGGRVAGTGAYIFANDMFYLEATAYGTLDTQTLQALGLDPTDPASRFDGLAPYWRAAVEKNWGNYSLMAGTFGMFANVAPLGNQSAPTDQITDVGADTQFQYIGDVHALTARLTYIWEHEKLTGSQPLGLSSKSSDNLQSFKLSASYVYDSIFSLSAGYFNLNGSTDPLLYSESLSPSAPGSPNSSGWNFDVALLPFSKGGPPLWPWLNMRLGVSFTLYDEFNGASTNYDGAGRNANDNNTTFFYAWTAF